MMKAWVIHIRSLVGKLKAERSIISQMLTRPVTRLKDISICRSKEK